MVRYVGVSCLHWDLYEPSRQDARSRQHCTAPVSGSGGYHQQEGKRVRAKTSNLLNVPHERAPTVLPVTLGKCLQFKVIYPLSMLTFILCIGDL